MRVNIVVTVLLAPLILAYACAADPHVQRGPHLRVIRTELQAEYANRLKVVRAKDLKAYALSMAADFVWVPPRPQRRRGKAAYLDLVETEMDAAANANGHTYRVGAISVRGKETAVKITERLTTPMKHHAGSARSFVAVYRETWVRTAHGWRTKRLEEISSATKITGR